MINLSRYIRLLLLQVGAKKPSHPIAPTGLLLHLGLVDGEIAIFGEEKHLQKKQTQMLWNLDEQIDSSMYI